MSSSSFQEYEHLRIPLEAIKSATNSFAYESGQSGQRIDIVARRLDRQHRQGYPQFWAELSVLSALKHENLVSIVGFCDEGEEKIIVNKYEVKGSLDRHLSNPKLRWLQRLRICVGAARALSYIHCDTGRSYDVIHRNIKSSKILLDENWEAKLCGFNLSIKNLANRRHRLTISPPDGTLGYQDPVYVNTGTVRYKADVYSFGVVLFEVICGRRAVIRSDTLARKHYEDGTLDELIDPNLRKQMDPQSFVIFSQAAYDCLNEQIKIKTTRYSNSC